MCVCLCVCTGACCPHLEWRTHSGSGSKPSHRQQEKWHNVQKAKVQAAQSCPTLCNPMDCIVWVLQARIVELVASPFSRGSSQPRDWTQVSRVAGGFFTGWATREALQCPEARSKISTWSCFCCKKGISLRSKWAHCIGEGSVCFHLNLGGYVNVISTILWSLGGTGCMFFCFLQRRDTERNRDGNRDEAGTGNWDTDGRELGGGAMEGEIGWERWRWHRSGRRVGGRMSQKQGWNRKLK